MTTMLKRAVAALALAGIVAGSLAPRLASAQTPNWPTYPQNLEVRRDANSPHEQGNRI